MPLFHFGFSAMASVNELQIWADSETDGRRGADDGDQVFSRGAAYARQAAERGQQRLAAPRPDPGHVVERRPQVAFRA